MPVSYEGSDVLKCTVSFTYSRYVINPRPVAQRQIEFEEALDAATGGSNPIPGTTSLGVAGDGTNRQLNNILINQGFA